MENQTQQILGASVTLLVLSTVFVAFRLLSRKLSKAGFWWDDVLIVVAMIFTYGLPICNIIAVKYGHGKHMLSNSSLSLEQRLEDLSTWFKILYAFQYTFLFASTFVKFSILVFYRRIFPIPQFKLPLLVTGLISLALMVALIFTTIFQCTPIQSFWTFSITRRCIDIDKVFIISGSINVVLDFIILALPIPILWRLRTTRFQKILLTGIFSFSAFVCLISIIRLVVLGRLSVDDITWNFVKPAIWTAAEPSLGIVSACIPSLRPLVTYVISGTHRGPIMDSVKTSSTVLSPTTWRTSESTEPRGAFIQLDGSTNEIESAWGHRVSVHGGHTGGKSADSIEEVEIPIEGITVKTEIMLLTSDRLNYNDRLF